MPSRPTPRLLVRADATARIGSGHLMRCRALAQALRELGGEVTFAIHEDSLEQAATLARDGFVVHVIESRGSESLDADDLDATIAQARALRAAVLVDHYGADDDYLRALAAAGLRVAVIDDLAVRDCAPAAWVLNQNLGAPADAYPGIANFLRGPRYALLRPEFARSRKNLTRGFASDDSRVLLTLGGGAYDHVVEALLAALDSVARPLSIAVLLGSSRPTPAGVERARLESSHEIEVLGQVRAMAQLIAGADVAVCAGGSTLWELACLGLPAAATALSDNQRPNVRACAAAGTVLPFDAARPQEAAQAVSLLLADPIRRRAMSRAGHRIVDGHGARRAAASLLAILAPSSRVVDALR